MALFAHSPFSLFFCTPTSDYSSPSRPDTRTFIIPCPLETGNPRYAPPLNISASHFALRCSSIELADVPASASSQSGTDRSMCSTKTFTSCTINILENTGRRTKRARASTGSSTSTTARRVFVKRTPLKFSAGLFRAITTRLRGSSSICEVKNEGMR